METTPVVVSAIAEKIDQLRAQLEKENNPEGLPIRILKFRVAHESAAGSVLTLRGTSLSLLSLFAKAEVLGLKVGALNTYRSGADSVAVVFVSELTEQLVNERIIETSLGRLLMYRDFDEQEQDVLCLLMWDKDGNRLLSTVGPFSSVESAQRAIAGYSPDAAEKLMRPFLTLA